MIFTSLCEHLERRCGVAALATLRARLLAASIDPQTSKLNWDCIDLQLESLITAHSMIGVEIFHLELMRTVFALDDGQPDIAAISRLVDEALTSDDEPESGPPLTAEQESLEAES